MEYGRKLAELRSNRGLSQEELAHAIDVAPSEISSWESCAAYPDQLHLAAAASVLKVQVISIIEDDVEEMLTAIRVAETRETIYMAGLAMLALACTAGMIATVQLAPSSIPGVANAVKFAMLAVFLLLIACRQSKASLTAKTYRDALEAADGSQSEFVLKRKAGKNTKLVTAQFILGAVLAASLIALLAIIEPGSRLPWVML